MDPNKRGNPPFEPSSYAAGLVRREERHRLWAKEARNMARLLLGENAEERRIAENWWRQQLDQPKVVVS